jgi:hypothetical protein
MELSESYDLFFENGGFCPHCGEYMVMHVGCIGVIVGEKKLRCPIYRLSYNSFCARNGITKGPRKYMWDKVNLIRKNLKYKYEWKKRRNLDIQGEKTYISTND